jgi:hypothetical protein
MPDHKNNRKEQTMNNSKTKRLPHAQIHLPPLEPGEALFFVEILERAVRAIWRAHGDQMADCLGARGIDTPMPEGAVLSGHPAPNPDDFPF